jgi:hypothetical protein
MLRSLSLVMLLPLAFGTSSSLAQTKKPSGPVKVPAATDASVGVNVYMRDAAKNELLLATRVWPDHPDYSAIALQRFFATMKALEPAYKQDDEVAYTWSSKGRVTKCSIYLESPEGGGRSGTGATVGCEANGVSALVVTSAGDPKQAPSLSQDPKHVSDVLAMLKKQSERARSALPKQ